MKIYVPMTADILTAGHIKFIEETRKQYKHPIIVIGLLTEKALKGYKKCVVPYKDREYILDSLEIVSSVVPQDSLDPYDNLIKTGCMAIASGDGWEEVEEKAINKWIEYHRTEQAKLGKEALEDFNWKPQVLDIKLKGEKNKLYSSSKIKKLCKKL